MGTAWTGIVPPGCILLGSLLGVVPLSHSMASGHGGSLTLPPSPLDCPTISCIIGSLGAASSQALELALKIALDRWGLMEGASLVASFGSSLQGSNAPVGGGNDEPSH